MRSTVAPDGDARHPEVSEIRPSRMAKADLRKSEPVDTWRARLGKAIDRTRQLSGLNLDEFAQAVGRDQRQVARWISGLERPQFDAIFAHPSLRHALLVALAELAGSGVEVTTSIRIQRLA